MTSTQTSTPIAPKAGMGASMVYVTDTRAMVITRVAPSGRTLWARSVELVDGPSVPEWTPARGELVPTRQAGDLSKPYGAEERYSLRKNGRWMRGQSRLIIGESYRRVDWRM